MEFGEAVKAVASYAIHHRGVVIKQAYKAVGTEQDYEEVKALADTAAYFAFLDLGGDPDKLNELPDRGAWQNLACDYFRKELEGPGSLAWEVRARLRNRRPVSQHNDVCWDLWKESVSEAGAISIDKIISRRGRRLVDIHGSGPCATDPTLLPVATVDSGFLKELEAVVLPQEFYLMVEHYIKGRPQPELAAEVLAKDPALQAKQNGGQLALGRVNSTLRRARVRAAKALGSKWLPVAKEIADNA